jgi:hypothetical protein
MGLDGSGLRPVASLFEPYGYGSPVNVENMSWGAIRRTGGLPYRDGGRRSAQSDRSTALI